MKTAIITGASSGLGKCFVKSMVAGGDLPEEVWLIARRKDRMEESAALLARAGVRTVLLALDLSKPESIDALAARMEEEKPEITLLINNAGFGTLGNVAESDYHTQMDQVAVNCGALTGLTCAALRYMKPGSGIVNVCSIASFCPNPRMTVYCSTKAYVLHYTKSLAYELKDTGIHAVAVCPGPMRTEFLNVAGITSENSKTFATLPYCDPQNVADKTLKALTGRGCVYTPRAFYKFYRVVAKVVPHNLLMPLSKA